MSLLFKNCLLVEVVYLLITFNKTKPFLWNTKNTNRNSVNEQNAHHTPHTYTQEDVFRNGYY